MENLDMDAVVFSDILMEDKESIERIRQTYGHALSAHAFVSLYLWQKDLKLSICIEKDAFLVRFRGRGENAYFFPCGNEEVKRHWINQIIHHPQTTFYYLREEDKNFLETFFPGQFFFEETREDAEYIYSLEAQLQLEGAAFKNLRKKIRKAQKAFEWKVTVLSGGEMEQAERVITEWKGGAVNGDRNAALTGIRQYEAIGFHGICLENEEGPKAVAMGSMITDDTFDLHVTKTLLPNMDSYLKWELFRRLPAKVKWINQEEDLGFTGLRTNKLEAVPHRITGLWKGVLR